MSHSRDDAAAWARVYAAFFQSPDDRGSWRAFGQYLTEFGLNLLRADIHGNQIEWHNQPSFQWVMSGQPWMEEVEIRSCLSDIRRKILALPNHGENDAELRDYAQRFEVDSSNDQARLEFCTRCVELLRTKFDRDFGDYQRERIEESKSPQERGSSPSPPPLAPEAMSSSSLQGNRFFTGEQPKENDGEEPVKRPSAGRHKDMG